MLGAATAHQRMTLYIENRAIRPAAVACWGLASHSLIGAGNAATMSAASGSDGSSAAPRVRVAVALPGGGVGGSGGAAEAQQPAAGNGASPPAGPGAGEAPKSARQLEIERLKNSLTARVTPPPRTSPGTGSGHGSEGAAGAAVGGGAGGGAEGSRSPPALPPALPAPPLGATSRPTAASHGLSAVGVTSGGQGAAARAGVGAEEDEKRGSKESGTASSAVGASRAGAGALEGDDEGSDAESRTGDTDEINLDSAEDEEEEEEGEGQGEGDGRGRAGSEGEGESCVRARWARWVAVALLRTAAPSCTSRYSHRCGLNLGGCIRCPHVSMQVAAAVAAAGTTTLTRQSWRKPCVRGALGPIATLPRRSCLPSRYAAFPSVSVVPRLSGREPGRQGPSHSRTDGEPRGGAGPAQENQHGDL
jgi:hypothetical protein